LNASGYQHWVEILKSLKYLWIGIAKSFLLLWNRFYYFQFSL
jgi:hypothetical protein